MAFQRQQRSDSLEKSSKEIIKRPPIPLDFVDYVYCVCVIADGLIYEIVKGCKNEFELKAYFSSSQYKELKKIAHSTHLLTTVPFTQMFHKRAEVYTAKECHYNYWECLRRNGVTNQAMDIISREYDNFKSSTQLLKRHRADNQAALKEAAKQIGDV